MVHSIMKAGRRKVSVSHGDKLMFPGSKISKIDIVSYYKRVAKYMLPHLEDRPLMLQRFPGGINKGGFFQKEASAHFPEWIHTISLPKEAGVVNHVICNDEATLIYLVNQGTVSFHTWLARMQAPDHPDKFIIDLDPSVDDFEMVRSAAILLKEFVEDLGIKVFAMVTGSSGVHVVVPLDGRSTFDESRETGNELAKLLTGLHPGLFTTERFKKHRGDKIYFDIQRNAYAQTAIAPYSIRPIEGAPVAVPVDWTELQDPLLNARSWHLKNIENLFANRVDPWKNMRRHAISVQSLRRKIEKFMVKAGVSD